MTRLLLLLLTMSMSAVGISAAFTNEDVPKIGVLLPTTNDPQDSSIVFRGFYGVSGWRAGSTRLESSSGGRNPIAITSGSGRYRGSSGYGSYGGYSSGGGWSGK